MFDNLPEDQRNQRVRWVQGDQHLPWVQCHHSRPWHQTDHQHPDVGVQETEQFIASCFILTHSGLLEHRFLQEVQQSQQVHQVQPLHAHPVKAKRKEKDCQPLKCTNHTSI